MSLFDNPPGQARCAALVLLLVAACESTPDKSPPPPTPRPSASVAAAPQPSQSAAPAGPDHSAAPGSLSGAGFAGSWQGTYDAKKGSVGLPPSVKDKTHVADDGKVMTGQGKVEITISPTGEVKGTATGALGEATLTGKVDDTGLLGVSWFPDDPTKPNAMTGVLTGLVKDGVVHGKIRVAGPDAAIVRESTIDLKRK